MKQDTQKTRVLFLIERDYDENNKEQFVENHIVAMFPEIDEGRNRVSCYAHVGQHSAGCMEYFNECIKATPEQYKDLREELESIGYNLHVLNEDQKALEDIYFSELKNW
jgi:hypothetical protein